MKKIMIVDDEADLRDMLKLMMTKQGYEVEIARDGEDFLSKVESFHPDLITLDVMMPGLTTEEILGKLKDKDDSTKIVLLTAARHSEEEKNDLRQRGNVVDYVTKPFDINSFLTTVEKYLE